LNFQLKIDEKQPKAIKNYLIRIISKNMVPEKD